MIMEKSIEEKNKVFAEFMGFPVPKIGSKWEYDRSLDASMITHDLIIKEIVDGNVRFEQKMPYEGYGLEYFDGLIFKPAEYPAYTLNDYHCPKRPYHSSWNWLMPVYRKMKDALRSIKTPPNSATKGDGIEVDIHCAVTEIDIKKAHNALFECISWYNQFITQPNNERQNNKN